MNEFTKLLHEAAPIITTALTSWVAWKQHKNRKDLKAIKLSVAGSNSQPRVVHVHPPKKAP